MRLEEAKQIVRNGDSEETAGYEEAVLTVLANLEAHETALEELSEARFLPEYFPEAISEKRYELQQMANDEPFEI